MKVLVVYSARVDMAGKIEEGFASARYKFVVGQGVDCYVLALAEMEERRSHVDMAGDVRDVGYTVLGGGRMFVTPTSVVMMQWNSPSMKESLGFDAPEDEKLLELIRDQLNRDLVAD